MAVATSGCASEFYWYEFREMRRPSEVLEATLSSEGYLSAKIRYQNGIIQVAYAHLQPGPTDYMPNYGHRAVTSVGPNVPLEGTQLVVVPSAEEAQKYTGAVLRHCRTNAFSVYQGNYHFSISVQDPAPFNWASREPYVAILLYPFPLAFDIVTFPVQLVFFWNNPVWL